MFIQRESHCELDHSPYLHHVPIITSRVRLPDRRLVRARAQLFGDRIEVSGWSLHGRYHRCISLGRIAHLESFAYHEHPHLTLFLDTDEVVILYMEDAFLWRSFFENWMRYDVLPSAKLVGEMEQAAALAG